jgi:poly(A) polymerase
VNQREFAHQIVLQLTDAGFESYWAGGCVRDLVLGIEPSDYDVATSAKPQEVRQIFGNSRTLAVGAAFGVIIVLSPDRKEQVEVATFRTDSSYSDGRHPDSVTFSTPEMDAQRRDFTINGMFFDPVAERVIDFVGGQTDLERSILRAIGNPAARINEDKLRMLRAIRFASRFNLQIEEETFQAVCNHAPEAALVSGERLAAELRKTLETNRPNWAVQQWAKTGLLKVLLPEVAEQWSLVSDEISCLLSARQPSNWLARLAATLWPCLGPDCEDGITELRARLKFSNEESQYLRIALTSQPVLEKARQLPWSQVQPLMIVPGIATAIDLIALKTHTNPELEQTLSWLRERQSWPRVKLDPAPLLTGQDLMNVGLQPSPRFKDLLHRIRCMQLDGQLGSAEQANSWLERQIK